MTLTQSIAPSFLLLALSIALSACERREPLVVAWTFNEPAVEISKLLAIELESDFIVTTRQFNDAAEITDAVKRGEVDLAIIEEPSQPISGVQVLQALFPSVLHVLAKPTIDDSQTIAKAVKGHNVYAGPPGGTGHEIVKLLVNQKVFPPRDQFNLLESVFDADPDIFIVFGGILSQDALERLTEFRLISLGAVEDYGRGSWAEGVTLRSPNIQPFIIPQGLYPGIGNESTLSLSVQSLLVTHPGLSEEAAYTVLSKVEEFIAQIRGIYSLAGRQMSHSDGTSFNLASHRGVLRYEQREAPGFLERYAELLAFLVTAILALSSLFIALLRMRKQARKDRIDVYFNQLLELRSELHNKSRSGVEINTAVTQLQHTVTQLVSDERISADSAFVGFLELSNQVLDESR